MYMKSATFASLLATVSAQSLTEAVAGVPELSSLGTLLGSVPDILNTLGQAQNITILAPSNSAIEEFTSSSAGQAAASDPELLGAVLSYHVINGTFNSSQIPDDLAFVPTLLEPGMYANVSGGQRLGVERDDSNVTVFSGLSNNSTVTQADLNFTGGIIHVIDRLLTLPASASDTLLAGGLTSLAGALTNASLVDTVNGLENVTIFAPANSAFRAIGGALPSLSAENVTEILTYHVVVGEMPLYSTSLSDGATAPTVQGNEVTVSINDDRIFVNGARVIRPNILIAGGVVHVIDNVLNPYNTTAAADDAEMGVVAFANATESTDEPFTSGVPSATTTLGGSMPTGTNTAAQGSATSSAAAAPMMTGAVAVAALFGAGAAIMNV